MTVFTKKIKRAPQRGFIALISTVLIATVLIGLALSVGGNGVSARFDVLNSEYKRVSLGLAESCANVALLRLAENYDYIPGAGGDSVTVGRDAQGRDEICIIQSVAFPNGKGEVQNTAVVKASAQYPTPNGANSSVAISATVQNPAYAVPAKGSITVLVNVVNDDGGTKQPSDFGVSVAATNAYPASFSGAGGSGTVVLMDAGSFSVVPGLVSGYTESDVGCTGIIAAGATQTCTITEDDIPTSATLTVIAQVKNDNGGTKVPGDFPLFLDGIAAVSGVPVAGLSAGSHSVSASPAPSGYTASVWGYDCNSSGSITLSVGNKKTCTVIFDDVPPPSPICVDTVLMLDRTGSMGGTDLSDERGAANGLLNLYGALTPLPKSSVGVFGAVGADEPYNAAIIRGLTTVYSSLLSAVSTGLSSSGGSTNLASAITAAQGEFDAHGTSGKGHVLILLSDGGANRPTGTVNADTGTRSPSASAPSGSGGSWTSATGAYAAGGSDADGAVNLSSREAYSNFAFPALPANAAIKGIEADTDAYVTDAPTALPLTLAPSAEGNYTAWTPNTGTNNSTNRRAAIQSAGGTYLRAGANGTADTFVMANAGIPTGSTVNSVTLYAVADTSGGTSNIQLRIESGTSNHKEDGGHAISSASFGTAISWTMASNPLTGSAWTYSQVNAWSTRFGVVRANSSGGTPQVDQIYIVVDYAPPAAVACQLGMDLSWNGGATWTTEKTHTLSGAPATYLYGSSSDDWSTTHTWVANDFTDANFIARVHAIDPGGGCDAAALEHLDWLRLRVYYSVTTDPYEAAYEAADAAKQAGTQIFTVHYGDKGTGNHDINFLANVADGSVTVAGHENGSANDLSDSSISGDTGLISPSTNAGDTGGGGNGFEVNPTSAYASGGTFASDMNGPGDRHRYGGYNFAVPAGANITGIVVRPDWWTDTTTGTNSVSIELSWDGGAHWTTAKTQGTESTSDTNTKTAGGSGDTWGRGWTTSDLASGNFLVRITANCSGSSSCSSRDFFLDWLAVQVYYNGGVPENGDDDNFFVSPTSGDMQSIFQAIGEKVCPALTAPPPAPPPSKGTLIVLTHVVNDNGGTNGASDFLMSVNGLNPSQTSFSGVESPGFSVTLDPGVYSANQAASGLLYVKTLGAACSGTIHAGDVLTCTITDDDIPAPPAPLPTAPPPPAPVNIGSWQEVP